MNTVIITILCIFAVYGVVRFIFSFIPIFRENPKQVGVHTVLLFRNNAEDAEALTRSLVWERALSGRDTGGDIIAVDLGSIDDTMPILRRLENEYEMVYAMNVEEYIKFVRDC